MIRPNMEAFFNSLAACWMNRILEADPSVHGWVQLSRMFLKSFDFNGLYVIFNFDDSVLFSNIEQLPPFYKAISVREDYIVLDQCTLFCKQLSLLWIFLRI